MPDNKKIQCDYCSSCVKKHGSGFDKFGRWIPPQFEEYQCMRTMRTLGNRSKLYPAGRKTPGLAPWDTSPARLSQFELEI